MQSFCVGLIFILELSLACFELALLTCDDLLDVRKLGIRLFELIREDILLANLGVVEGLEGSAVTLQLLFLIFCFFKHVQE